MLITRKTASGRRVGTSSGSKARSAKPFEYPKPRPNARQGVGVVSDLAPVVRPGDDSPSVVLDSSRHLVGRGKFSGYVLRGRWFKEDRYVGLRNAAWMLRNSRVGQAYNPAALALVLHEAKGLMRSGEDLYDVLEAFSELLIHP